MGIPDHLTCLLRNLYADQEATVRTGHETTDWFKIGKGHVKAVYCHPAYLTSMQSTLREMLGWMKHKLESRLPEEISTASICRWYHSNSKKWRGTKKLLDEGKRGEWKSWLKTEHSKTKDHSFWSHYLVANRWGKNGNSDGFYFPGLQNHCG